MCTQGHRSSPVREVCQHNSTESRGKSELKLLSRLLARSFHTAASASRISGKLPGHGLKAWRLLFLSLFKLTPNALNFSLPPFSLFSLLLLMLSFSPRCYALKAPSTIQRSLVRTRRGKNVALLLFCRAAGQQPTRTNSPTKRAFYHR